jgi:hypothetical protein
MVTILRTCRHLMPTGRTCQCVAMTTSAYCYYHARLHNRTGRVTKPRNTLQLPVLDSREAVCEGLHKVMNLLLAGKIDSRKAGRILYGIQTAVGQLNNERKYPQPTPKA